MPGVFMSMISTLMPLCLGAAGSVRTKQRHQSAWCAPEVHTFWPFTTKWSPSSTARVDSAARSLRAQRREQEPLLLLGRPVVLDRRGHDAEPLRVQAAMEVALGELLEVDHLLGRARIATAELRRPAGNEPAVVEQRPLPPPRPRREVGARLLPLVHDLPRRRVLVEPRDEVATELLFRFAVPQSHGRDRTRYSPAPWTSSSARIRSCCARRFE